MKIFKTDTEVNEMIQWLSDHGVELRQMTRDECVLRFTLKTWQSVSVVMEYCRDRSYWMEIAKTGNLFEWEIIIDTHPFSTNFN